MLLAEIQGKLKGTFGCAICGDDGISLEARVATEDALTSTVFGALRWLPPELGLLPLLQLLELPGTETVERRCEPDAIIDAPAQSFVLIEVKLDSKLGGDPLQLPKEAIFAHRR